MKESRQEIEEVTTSISKSLHESTIEINRIKEMVNLLLQRNVIMEGDQVHQRYLDIIERYEGISEETLSILEETGWFVDVTS